MVRQQNLGLRAEREEHFPNRAPHGVRGRSPGDFLGTFVEIQKYLA